MPLKSLLFEGNERLNACLVDHAAHVVPGDSGEHVGDIQIALQHLDDLQIDQTELATQTYGPSTAAAVLAYKRKRKIINTTYQTSEDDIVGKMTIASLDQELFDQQTEPAPATDGYCTQHGGLEPKIRRLGAPPREVPMDIVARWRVAGLLRG